MLLQACQLYTIVVAQIARVNLGIPYRPPATAKNSVLRSSAACGPGGGNRVADAVRQRHPCPVGWPGIDTLDTL
jgi:hypothetical protein